MEEEKKIEIDWRQRLRQMWLKEGMANRRFVPTHSKLQKEIELDIQRAGGESGVRQITGYR